MRDWRDLHSLRREEDHQTQSMGVIVGRSPRNHDATFVDQMDGCTMRAPYTADVTVAYAVRVPGGSRDGRTRALNRQRDGSETVLPSCYGRDTEARRMRDSLFSGRRRLRLAARPRSSAWAA